MGPARTNTMRRAGLSTVRAAGCAACSACSRLFQRARAEVLGWRGWRGRLVGLPATLAWWSATGTRWVRTNSNYSRCVILLLIALALRAFLGVSPIGTERHIVSSLSVVELCPLLSPRCCASLASPLEQQPHMHTPAASFCALLTALPLLFVPEHLSSHYSCIGGVEKAHRELQFVRRRPQTPEIRCSRNALCSNDLHPASVHF